MNIVMPMAGRGSRMLDGGYTTPKPLIQLKGRPMFRWALHSVEDLLRDNRLIIVALEEHALHWNLRQTLEAYLEHPFDLVLIPEVTEGQLCTVLYTEHKLLLHEDLLVLSSDTLVVSNIAGDIADCASDCHGLISVSDLPGDRWSFAMTNAFGTVTEVAEKVRISDHASTGIYYFRHTSEFLQYAHEIVESAQQERGEYFVIPVYKKYIERGLEIRISIADKVWDMGNPQSAREFNLLFQAH